MAGQGLVYVDSSAFVKLVIAEPETPALVAALADAQLLLASEILEVEVLRAARRVAGVDGAEAARDQLDGVRLLPLNDAIRVSAAQLDPPAVRSLDAIHLATALQLGEQLDGLYVYDDRMSEAARALGLTVYTPA